ncbi:odorant receptor 49b-like [Lasioglossum baleicum]|uniref:odorant receptor 49b-like n=1 Tax=Lasioglossum baleicum TaxID=434251 RepID=UPI003FCE37ED
MFGIGSDDFALSLASIFLRLTGIWTSKNRIELCCRTFAACYSIFMVSLCVFVLSLDFIRGGLDAGDLLYALVNILCTFNDLFKMCVMFVYKKEFLVLLVHLRRHFLEADYDTYEKTIVDACRSSCAIFVSFFTFFSHMTLVGYVLGPLIVSIGKNESERMFPFNLPKVPFYTTPYFEITFFVQVLLIYQSGLCHFCFDNILCIMNLHVATQFRILQYRLSNLKCEDVVEDSASRVPSATENSYMMFKKCVQQHKRLIAFCNKLEEVFNLIALAEVFIFSMLICLSGFQMLMVSTSKMLYLVFLLYYSKSAFTATTVGRRCTFLFFFATCSVQLLMFTYSCDGLIQESLNVATAAYSSPWSYSPMNKYGKMLRKDVILVIMRSRVPCCLTAKGFFPVSLQTYTKVRKIIKKSAIYIKNNFNRPIKLTTFLKT